MSAAALAASTAAPLSGPKEMSLEKPKKITREDWRKKKDLEEQDHSQRNESSVGSSGEWYKRGVKENSITTKYQKGACENWSHDTQKETKFTETKIAPDEHVQPQLIPEESVKIPKKLKEELASGKLVEQANSLKHQIREDIAKYLRNLDPNSAYYDSKTGAMRENPYVNAGKNPDEVSYAGDNFVRYTGDTVSMAQTQLFAWEAYDKECEVHLQADPTKLELLYESFKVKKEDVKEQQKKSILEKYSSQEHLDAPPAKLLLAQTEDYEWAVACSKDEEDVNINNHTHIWGSYWKEGRWGYKCCHSFFKYSYCTAEAGDEIASSKECIINDATGEESVKKKPQTLMEMHQEKLKEEKKKKRKHQKSSAESDDEEKKHENIYETREPTEEEMEAYGMKRQRPDDPVASFLGQ
ncbi:hypothetical protein FD754_009258 [Muntiacus muntjak]|uniref:Pre-mRNA-splicing factor SLU7 n=1 Tax=Muntiacus muntjak TaxID=9888 RepID=A0A5N3WTE3_MUNMU|nr:hypothetical protein FD754_009258 [Muntiacus muntjak]